MPSDVSEKNERLWVLAAPPSVWAIHFLVSYGVVAVWCAKVGGSESFAIVRLTVALLSVLCLAAIAYLGLRGARRHRLGGGVAEVPHDDDTPEDRHRFLGLATALLAGLSAIAVVYEALVVFFFRSCA